MTHHITPDSGVLWLCLPWPPSVNHYYQPTTRRSGRRVHSSIVLGAKAKQYRQRVVSLLRGHISEPFSVPLAMHQVLHEPKGPTGDIDNRNKGLLDALTHAGVWTDDKLVRRLVIDYGEPVEGGMIEVWIEPLARGVI